MAALAAAAAADGGEAAERLDVPVSPPEIAWLERFWVQKQRRRTGCPKISFDAEAGVVSFSTDIDTSVGEAEEGDAREVPVPGLADLQKLQKTLTKDLSKLHVEDQGKAASLFSFVVTTQ